MTPPSTFPKGALPYPAPYAGRSPGEAVQQPARGDQPENLRLHLMEPLMDKLQPDLIFADNAAPFTKLCIDATFYWRGSMYERGPSLAAAYRHALSAVESDILYFETGSMAGAKKLKADSLGMVPCWLEKAKRREDICIMHLKAGNTADEPTDRAVYFMADEEDDVPVGALKLSLPVSWADKPQQLLQTVLTIAGDAAFESGHCGYSLAWDDRGDGAPDALLRMHHLGGRYQGVDLYKVNTVSSRPFFHPSELLVPN